MGRYEKKNLNPSEIKIGFPTSLFFNNLDNEVNEITMRAIEKLKAAGF
jgi:hypothetical protein